MYNCDRYAYFENQIGKVNVVGKRFDWVKVKDTISIKDLGYVYICR